MRVEIGKVCVVGAGYMGSGIAEMAALAGYRVCLHDLTEQRLEAGMEEIRASLGKFVSRGKVTEAAAVAALAAIEPATTLEAAGEVDLVVEAVSEDLELKRRIFGHLDELCPAHAVLATNTSAIPISSIAAATRRPEQVVGTHFFGPVPVMRLCEIIRGLRTSDAAFDAADAWARSLGKETVLVQRDHAGFIANRLNIPATLEMVRMVEEGGMTPAEVDRAASFGLEGRVGPLEILDNAGLDISLSAASAIYADTGDPKFFPPPLLARMVAAGLLGRKTGRGFYDYSSGMKQEYRLVRSPSEGESSPPPAGDPGQLAFRMLMPTIVEAVLMLQSGVARADDIDRATRLGFNFPMGPLELADNTGLDTILQMARSIYSATGDPKFFPPSLLARMVEAGHLGRAAGRGFYVYEG